MENTIKETTRLLLNGTLTKKAADKILLSLYNVSGFYCWEKECNLPKCEKACDVCRGSKLKPN